MSTSDVENYKQIKTDLDELRLLVEKSELWVYKSKKGQRRSDKKKEKKEAVKDEDRKDSMDGATPLSSPKVRHLAALRRGLNGALQARRTKVQIQVHLLGHASSVEMSDE